MLLADLVNNLTQAFTKEYCSGKRDAVGKFLDRADLSSLGMPKKQAMKFVERDLEKRVRRARKNGKEACAAEIEAIRAELLQGLPQETATSAVAQVDPEAEAQLEEFLQVLLRHTDTPEDLSKIWSDHPHAPPGTFLLSSPAEELAELCATTNKK